MHGSRRLATLALAWAALMASLGAAPASGAPAACTARHWVATWLASPGSGAGPGFEDQTLRTIVTPHLGGSVLRVRLSNRFGTQPVTFDAVTVARHADGAGLVARTVTPVTFRGRDAIAIPAGHDAVSDRVPLRFRAFQQLAVSLSVAGRSGPATQHLIGQQTSYTTERGSGDHTADAGARRFTGETTTSRFFLTGLDVRLPGAVGAVAAFGDSLTDGYLGSASSLEPNLEGLDRDGRYPDALQRRLRRAGGAAARISVVDAGITGNRLLEDGVLPEHGAAGTARFRPDALDQAGVTHVIAQLGLNDIGAESAGADEIVAGLANLVDQAHARRLRILLGTLPPTQGALSVTYGNERAEALRRTVNTWIRTESDADGVVDFDHALRDPIDLDRLDPRYDSGDHLHPNLAGYRAMASAVDLGALRPEREC
jgi:lysophospholipase L1-like esterase